MSIAKNHVIHLTAPEKIEIEGRSSECTQENDNRDAAWYQELRDNRDKDNGRNFQINVRQSPSRPSISIGESMANIESSDFAKLTAEVTKLEMLLQKKQAENNIIAHEKDNLKASYVESEKHRADLLAYIKQMEDKKEGLHISAKDQLKQKQAKIDELRSIVEKKTAENKQIADEKDTLAAECKQIRRDKNELEVFTKKKMAITKDKYMKLLQERNDKLDAAYTEIAKLKSLLAKKETENKQITDENELLEAKYLKSRTDKKQLEVFAKKKLLTTKHKYQKVLQERNVMIKQKQDKIDALNRRNHR